MPNGGGSHEAIGEGVTELVTEVPHGGLVTVEFNTDLFIVHPIIRCVCVCVCCVLCLNTLWVCL